MHSVTGDLLGTGTCTSTVADVDSCRLRVIAKAQVWSRAATGPWPAWTLLTSTDWLWVALSRMLVRRTWIDHSPLRSGSSWFWFPAVAFSSSRPGPRSPHGRSPRFLAALGGGGVLERRLLAFVLAVNFSAQMGWFASTRATRSSSLSRSSWRHSPPWLTYATTAFAPSASGQASPSPPPPTPASCWVSFRSSNISARCDTVARRAIARAE